MIKIATIVGARPQFIKAAVVSRAILEFNKIICAEKVQISEKIIHTGQHYDWNMSDVFFEEMQIPKTNYFLDVKNLPHGAMTGQMLEKIEAFLMRENPDFVLVYGDTNTTLAGALAAVKIHIPVAHVEAGLRSFNRRMPEEVNRVFTDHVSNILFCPTKQAAENLAREGIGEYRMADRHNGSAVSNNDQLACSHVLTKIRIRDISEMWITKIEKYPNCGNSYDEQFKKNNRDVNLPVSAVGFICDPNRS